MASRERDKQMARRVWRVPGPLWMVFGLLAMNFAIVGATVTLASRDAHFAVEPDYYQRAVDWDATRLELERSEELGWSLRLDAADAASASGMRTLTVRLNDQSGEPIGSARVVGIAFHHGAASSRTDVAFVERGPGVYQGDVPLVGAGLHEVRIVASRGDDRFLAAIRQDWKPVR